MGMLNEVSNDQTICYATIWRAVTLSSRNKLRNYTNRQHYCHPPTGIGLAVVAVGAIEDVVKVLIASNADVVIAGIVGVVAIANVDVLADSNVDVVVGAITVAGDEELADTIDTVDEADGISVTDWKLLFVCCINCPEDGSTSFDS